MTSHEQIWARAKEIALTETKWHPGIKKEHIERLCSFIAHQVLKTLTGALMDIAEVTEDNIRNETKVEVDAWTFPCP